MKFPHVEENICLKLGLASLAISQASKSSGACRKANMADVEILAFYSVQWTSAGFDIDPLTCSLVGTFSMVIYINFYSNCSVIIVFYTNHKILFIVRRINLN